MRNIDVARQLREAWNNNYSEEYDQLLNMYKEQGYRVRRNDKTSEHIVEKTQNFDMFKGTPFENIFR